MQLALVRITIEDFNEAWSFFQKFKDKKFSFTNCTILSIIKRLKIKILLFDTKPYETILTSNVKDFNDICRIFKIDLIKFERI